jgi:pimeloyl-ACP methyl ester carboxylesterase
MPYVPRRAASSQWCTARGLRHHLNVWGDPSMVGADRPPLVMLHGWMDVGASFQFVVDALRADRYVIAPDLRGFGFTEARAGTDTYWFPDYLGDLDALLDRTVEMRWPGMPIDLLGHSMGGNVAMFYAGIRPERVRRLVNLEGFGMPETRPSQAPGRYAQWLDQLKAPAEMRGYDSLEAVAARLRRTNPLLRTDRALWLAAHWSREVPGEGGTPSRWHVLADPVHKQVSPMLYRRDEAIECWKRIAAPVLWVDGDRSDVTARWKGAYPAGEIEARLAVVQNVERQRLESAGHMLHHDQPEALAERVERFLERAGTE